jgi:hypothetical protein
MKNNDSSRRYKYNTSTDTINMLSHFTSTSIYIYDFIHFLLLLLLLDCC